MGDGEGEGGSSLFVCDLWFGCELGEGVVVYGGCMCWHEVAHLGAAARRLPSSAVLAWPGDIMGMRTSLTLTPSSCSQLSAGVLPACVGIDTGLVMPPSATLLPLHRSTASHMELTHHRLPAMSRLCTRDPCIVQCSARGLVCASVVSLPLFLQTQQRVLSADGVCKCPTI